MNLVSRVEPFLNISMEAVAGPINHIVMFMESESPIGVILYDSKPLSPTVPPSNASSGFSLINNKLNLNYGYLI